MRPMAKYLTGRPSTATVSQRPSGRRSGSAETPTNSGSKSSGAHLTKPLMKLWIPPIWSLAGSIGTRMSGRTGRGDGIAQVAAASLRSLQAREATTPAAASTR